MFGLFSPARHELKEYLKYDITQFKDKIRFLEICTNRDGEANAICPLYFNGAVSYFEELPLPFELEQLTKFYENIHKSTKSINLIYTNTISLWEKLLAFLANLGKVKLPQ